MVTVETANQFADLVFLIGFVLGLCLGFGLGRLFS